MSAGGMQRLRDRLRMVERERDEAESMFAAAVWSQPNHTLTVYRDALGESIEPERVDFRTWHSTRFTARLVRRP